MSGWKFTAWHLYVGGVGSIAAAILLGCGLAPAMAFVGIALLLAAMIKGNTL